MTGTYHTGSLEDKHFLVTGGAGFIGSNIVEYLMEHGAGTVRVLDNLATGNLVNIQEFREKPGFQFQEGDIRNLDDCRRAVDGIDFVMHQAALGSVPRSIKDPATSQAVNAGGFLNMLIASAEANVKRVVYASSSSVYGDEASLPKVEERTGNPLSPYAVTKQANELDASVFSSVHGLSCIGLRYFNVFGPHQSPEGPYAAVVPLFIDATMKGEAVYIDGDGEQTRDFTYVANAVQANIKSALNGPDIANEVFNVAVGENFSINELFSSINTLGNNGAQAVHRDARAGDVRDSLADISKARELIGYEPEVKFADGIQNTFEYWKNKASVS